MTTHYDDEAQAEAVKRWWRENWKALGLGLAIGLGGVGGWQAWQQHRENQALEGSRLYNDLQKAVLEHRPTDGIAIVDRLIKDYDGTPYAAMGQLQLAAVAVNAGKYDEANARLKWAALHAADPGMAAVARLRMAQVVWQLGKPDEALADLAQPPAAFAGVYQQLSGDILLSMGRRAEAKRAYAAALNALPADAPDRSSLQHTLDSLSDVAAAS